MLRAPESTSVQRAAVAAGLLPGPGPADRPAPEPGARHTLPLVSVAALDLAPRPPTLCPGCPHRSSFYLLHKLGVKDTVGLMRCAVKLGVVLADE